MASQKLTARVLSNLQPGALVRDNVVRGLFAQAADGSGVVSLKIQADLRRGPRTGEARKPISVRMTLGRFPALSVDAARVEAMRLLAEIRAGNDPRASASTPAVPLSAWTVTRMRDEYVKDLAIREKSERTAADLQYLFKQYLSDWLPLPAGAITKEMARERHAHISVKNGKAVANKALKAFRTTFNFAKRVQDAPLGENPAEAVTYHRQRSREAVIMFPDLPAWLGKVRTLPNKLRAAMHELQLVTGLRPGTLVALERAWLRLEERAIVIPAPRMKSRREFACPLSTHAADIVQRALVAGDVNFPGSAYLFPTRDAAGTVVATRVWKEKRLPGETGHILRHTYSSLANAAGVSSVNRQLLLGQKVPGVEGVYLQERALFATLLAEQERLSAFILARVAL